MKILLVDTTSIHCYVAVIDTTVTNGTIYNCKTAHSEALCSAVDKTMRLANINFADLDCYAVGIGTGSFTGIRIGVSTVLGYNRAVNKPIVALPTLDMLHYHSGCDSVVQDAGNGYYYCHYTNGEATMSPQLIDYCDTRAEGAYMFDKEADYIDSLVALAITMYNKRQFSDDVTPLYIRRSQAEIEYDQKNNQ